MEFTYDINQYKYIDNLAGLVGRLPKQELYRLIKCACCVKQFQTCGSEGDSLIILDGKKEIVRMTFSEAKVVLDQPFDRNINELLKAVRDARN